MKIENDLAVLPSHDKHHLSVRKANSKPELSQLLFISVRQRELVRVLYHKWSLTICDGCFDTLKSSKMQS